MSDILRQIDADLRKDRLLKIWKTYWVYIVGIIVGLLVILTSYQLYLSSTQSKNEKIVEQYINAVNSGDASNTIDLLSELDDSSNSYIKGFAKLKKAELYMILDDEESAVPILESIFNDSSLDEIIRDLALYKYLMFQIDIIDDEKFNELINARDLQKSRFKFLFKELQALKVLISGDKMKSSSLFQGILDNPKFPTDIKTRAEKFLKISR
jgi:hypothetical protein